MKKLLTHIDTFFVSTLLLGISLTLTTTHVLDQSANRRPSGAENTYELHIQNLGLDPSSRLNSQEKVFIRVTFNKKYEMELGKNSSWALHKGDNLPLDVKLDINDAWVKNDGLDFTVELVSASGFQSTLLNCTTVAKDISVYNRAYQCAVKGEKNPIISYRLAKKGSPIPDANSLAFSK
jgi:hypothetical protein